MKRFPGWLVLLCSLAAAQVHAQRSIDDFFGPIVEWRQASGLEVTPIHVGLLPDGRLFFINEFNFFENPGKNIAAPGFEAEYMFLMQPTPAASPPPAAVLIQPLANPASLPCRRRVPRGGRTAVASLGPRGGDMFPDVPHRRPG